MVCVLKLCVLYGGLQIFLCLLLCCQTHWCLFWVGDMIMLFVDLIVAVKTFIDVFFFFFFSFFNFLFPFQVFFYHLLQSSWVDFQNNTNSGVHSISQYIRQNWPLTSVAYSTKPYMHSNHSQQYPVITWFLKKMIFPDLRNEP